MCEAKCQDFNAKATQGYNPHIGNTSATRVKDGDLPNGAKVLCGTCATYLKAKRSLWYNCSSKISQQTFRTCSLSSKKNTLTQYSCHGLLNNSTHPSLVLFGGRICFPEVYRRCIFPKQLLKCLGIERPARDSVKVGVAG